MAYRRGFVDNSVMRRIEVKQLNYDLTPVGGLALVGHYLKAMTPQWAGLDSRPCEIQTAAANRSDNDAGQRC